MSIAGRAYITTLAALITSPGGTLVVVPNGKRAVIVSGFISISEASAGPDDYVEIIGQSSTLVFHATQSVVGVRTFGPYENGVELADGADIMVTITGATPCYAQVEYYLENTYLG